MRALSASAPEARRAARAASATFVEVPDTPPELDPEFLEADLVDLLEDDGAAAPVDAADATTLQRPIDANTSSRRDSARRTAAARRLAQLERAPSRPLPAGHALSDVDGLVTEARRRAESLAKHEGRAALARARLEHALLLEVLKRDPAAAEAEYRSAHAIAPTLRAPIAAVRRLAPYGKIASSLALLEAELRATTDEPSRAIRLLELGRLLLVGGAAPDKAVQAFRNVLALVPEHPAALRGLERALRARPRALEQQSLVDALAAHLALMASAFRDDARLSAWLEVERALLLERLQRPDAARAALEGAVRLDPGTGPVRQAYVQHLLAHQNVDQLVEAWSEEATLEGDTARAGSLLYAAGRLASERLEQSARAIELHRRATALTATLLFTRRRALAELARLYQRQADALRALEAELQILAWAEPTERPHWHARLATSFDALDRWEEAAEHAHRAMSAWPDDDDLRARLDAMLAACRKHEQRLAMWMLEASRVTSTRERVDALLRAAAIAENDLGRKAAARTALRAAWALEPDHLLVCDELARLLATSPGDGPAPDSQQARIDFLREMAASTADPERKIAHLEKLAAMFEDQTAAPERARDVYREILALDGKRRGAIIGLARTAARAGDARELFRALVLEADLVGSAALSRSLLLRAADLASRELSDPDAALDLLKRVLQRNAGDQQALRAAADVHLRVGRYEDAILQLRVLLQHLRKGSGALAIAIEIARLFDERLRRPADAIAAYRDARSLDPSHLLPPAELRRLHAASEDHAGLARELVASAAALASEPSPASRAARGRLLFEAAEVYGDRLDEPDLQRELLVQARACSPEEADIERALARVYLRQARAPGTVSTLEPSAAAAPHDELALAARLADDRDPARAAALLRAMIERGDANVAIVRTLEHAALRGEQWADLAFALRSQHALFASKEARLGTLGELFVLEQLRGVAPPAGAPTAIELLSQAAPDDVLVHEAILRSGLTASDGAHAERLASSLGVLAAASNDALTSGALQLAAGLLLESRDSEDPHRRREAARRYRVALAAWPDCLTAARGLFRLGTGLADKAALIAGAIALGSLEGDEAVRAERLCDAAEALAETGEGARAEQLYLRALTESADCARAAEGLFAAAKTSPAPGDIAGALRSAAERTTRPEHAVRLGAELANLARERLADPTVALEALRRARKKAPGHVGNLLALADACADVALWQESAEIAEGALGITRDASERLGAAVLIARAHTELPGAAVEAAHRARQAEDLSAAARPEAQASWLGRLAKVYRSLGEREAELRVLARALASAGASTRALDVLAEHAPPDAPETAMEYARVIEQCIALAPKLGVAVQPLWLTALANAEVTQLGRVREGLAHVHDALALDNGDVRTYEALARLSTVSRGAEHAARELLAQLPAVLAAGLTGDGAAQVVDVVARACAAASLAGEAAQLAQIAAYLRGDLKSRVASWSDGAPRPGALTAPTLSALLASPDVRPWLEVAAAVHDVLPKLLRADPVALGAAARDRLLRGDTHPLRALADRLARGFGDLQFELYVDVGSVAAPRLVPAETPAIVLPRGYGDLPGREQAAGIARLLVYIALRVPWVEELASDDLAGVLFGSLRAGRDGWKLSGWTPAREASVESFRMRLGRALSRKQKRSLEELADQRSVTEAADPERFRAEMRAVALLGAYLLTGDLVSTLNHLRRVDRERASAGAQSILQLAAARRLMCFALQPDAMALVRAVAG